jgi:hypothetical protein
MEPSKAPEIFLKPYDPAAREPLILDLWEKSGYANPDVCIEKGVLRRNGGIAWQMSSDMARHDASPQVILTVRTKADDQCHRLTGKGTWQ